MTVAVPLQGLALQSNPTTEDPLTLAAWLLGVGVAAATAAGLVALAYRWYVRERVPTGLGVLFGLTVVSVYVGATGALGAVISNPEAEEAILRASEALPNLAAFAVGAAGSSVGIRAGDAVGTDLFAATGGKKVDRDVSEIVQTVGRVTSVRLPEDIEDIVGYDPVPAATTETLAGRHFLFPRRLRKGELHERLVSRLKTDYGVGHVDLELNDDGTVEYLAIGSRAAGIGPTLPPATNAVAIRADPAHAASAGDLVQVWETDPLKRVLTGELRGVAGDIVTVAIDAGDTPKLDPTTTYKLVTLPVQDRPDREFASLLRAAEETMGTVTIPENSELVGTTVGELGVTVAAITREGAAPEPIPSRNRELSAGDVVYAIAKPDSLRQVETAAGRQRAVETPPVEAADDDAGVEGDATDDSDETTAGAEPSAAETVTETAADESDDTEVADKTGKADEAVADETGDAKAADATGTTDATEEGDDDAVADQSDGERAGGDVSVTDEALLGEDSETLPADDASTQPPPADETPPPPESTDESDDGDGAAEETIQTDDESVRVWDPEEQLETDDDTESSTDDGQPESERRGRDEGSADGADDPKQ